ncbi:hypothetical protein EVAR_100611_1 [Eumeta japonica]|uniref:Uncharacterized protein n=1 Tax=Eumeta variegata TaxID=151549 RepID=A0A4C1ZBY5_EUMVA|nr:hypothetical protein EVAR_100611_1 [Eumeta japonica]
MTHVRRRPNNEFPNHPKRASCDWRTRDIVREYAEIHYFNVVSKENAPLAASFYKEQLERRAGLRQSTYPDYRVFLRVHNGYIEGRIPGRFLEDTKNRSLTTLRLYWKKF